jgi:hypothetical protein
LSIRRLAVAAVALAAVAGVPLAGCGDDDDGGGDGGLSTERTRRASGVPVRADDPILWGNFIVWPATDRTAELRGVALRGATGGLRIRRALVATGRRPQERLLAAGREDFLNGFPVRDWQASFRPLRGHEVKPMDGPWDPEFGSDRGTRRTTDGVFESTEIVLELAPPGRGRFRVADGIRLRYTVDGDERHIDLPNQLMVCAPKPCKTPRPVGF